VTFIYFLDRWGRDSRDTRDNRDSRDNRDNRDSRFDRDRRKQEDETPEWADVDPHLEFDLSSATFEAQDNKRSQHGDRDRRPRDFDTFESLNSGSWSSKMPSVADIERERQEFKLKFAASKQRDLDAGYEDMSAEFQFNDQASLRRKDRNDIEQENPWIGDEEGEALEPETEQEQPKVETIREPEREPEPVLPVLNTPAPAKT
jgi:hypothetical protein